MGCPQINYVLSANTEHKYGPCWALLRVHEAFQYEAYRVPKNHPCKRWVLCFPGGPCCLYQCTMDPAAVETHDLEHALVCLLELGGSLPSRGQYTSQEVFSNTPHLKGKWLNSTGNVWSKIEKHHRLKVRGITTEHKQSKRKKASLVKTTGVTTKANENQKEARSSLADQINICNIQRSKREGSECNAINVGDMSFYCIKISYLRTLL